MKKVDVLIVGAGPAGSTCANLLLQKKVSCMLIDYATFPRDKICGGALSVKSWRLLDSLLPGITYDYYGLRRLHLLIDGHEGCQFEAEQELRIVRRHDFDHTLLKYYLSHGGDFHKDSPKAISELADGSIQVELASGETVVCRYLVGADGSNSFVRRYLTGRREHGILAMEQYVEKGTYDDRNDLVADLCRKYDKGGYFYRFPNRDFEVIGYGDMSTTPDRFREVLRQRNLPEGKLRGAYIYLSNDYPLNRHILLIGDAGGFANRLTCEGIYDAFKTACNAATAIVENRPFSEVNSKVFAKMKKETAFANFFFSATGFALLRVMCHFPSIIKWLFDTKMKRESFIKI